MIISPLLLTTIIIIITIILLLWSPLKQYEKLENDAITHYRTAYLAFTFLFVSSDIFLWKIIYYEVSTCLYALLTTHVATKSTSEKEKKQRDGDSVYGQFTEEKEKVW